MRHILLTLLLLLITAAAPSHASVFRLTITGVVGAPTSVRGTPPLAEGMNFLLRFEIDESLPDIVGPFLLGYSQHPLFQQFEGSDVPAGTTNASIHFGTLQNMLITTSLRGDGIDSLVFGPIPWNYNPTDPHFTPGTTSLTVGILDVIGSGPYAFTSGITGGTLVIESVPEPGSAALLAIPVAGLGLARLRRRRRCCPRG